MPFSDLFSKRLILLSGKGGVGKTTVACALGLASAKLRKNTLLVEMNSTERLAPLFGLDKIGPHEIPLAPYLTGINLDPRECFEEYVLMQIHFRMLFDTFFNNRFVSLFLNAIPGLNELLMIGKICFLERAIKNKKTGEPAYDLIIVDGPATGHGLSTFEVPQVVHDAVRVGPLRKQAERILNLLNNPKKTTFSVVTLAEEMPVMEATELLDNVRKKLKMPLGPLFVNAFHDSPFTKTDREKMSRLNSPENQSLAPYFACSLLESERNELNEDYLKMLREKNPGHETITLPFLYREIKSSHDLKPLVDYFLKLI